MVVYRNTATGRITRLSEPSPQMDRSTRWEQIDPDVLDPEPAEEPPVFDPAQHSVGEVNAYLLEAWADERQRVLDAEAAGKARRRILGTLGGTLGTEE